MLLGKETERLVSHKCQACGLSNTELKKLVTKYSTALCYMHQYRCGDCYHDYYPLGSVNGMVLFFNRRNVDTIVLACYIARIIKACYLGSQFIDSCGYVMIAFIVGIRPI